MVCQLIFLSLFAELVVQLPMGAISTTVMWPPFTNHYIHNTQPVWSNDWMYLSSNCFKSVKIIVKIISPG